MPIATPMGWRGVARALVVALLCASFAGCAPERLRREPSAAAPAADRAIDYAAASRAGERVLAIESARSVIAVEVRRDGPLARVGHDHVVASHTVRGYVAPSRNRADLSFALADLVVDEPALRADAGFTTQPSAADIEGTRRNMLDKVLHADQHPVVTVALTRARGEAATLQAAVTLNGVTRTFDVAAEIADQNDEMTIRGRVTLAQSDFGIVPFSILGGALRVADPLLVRFDIRARRL